MTSGAITPANLCNIIDTLPFGIVMLDNNSRIQACNHAVKRMLEQPIPSLIGKFVSSLLPHKLHHSIELQEGHQFDVAVSSGRTIRWIYHSVSISGFMGILILIDISEEVNLRHKLDSVQEALLDLEIVFDNSPDEIFVTDGQGVTLRVNSACERLYGVPRSYLVGKNVKELENEGAFFPSITPRVLQSKKPVTVVQDTRSGRKILAIANPVFDDSGNLIRIVTNSRDVSEFYDLKAKLTETENLMQRYISEVEMLRKEQTKIDGIVVKSQAMREVFETARRVASFDSTVLLQGETGTGKDVVAKSIHRLSSRSSGPYIKINCGAVPETLLESEFFGYAPGAFTGALRSGKPGVIELAHGGTLFLNEIDALPLSLQVKLLAVIQESRFMRVGGTKEVSVDTRFIAASNRNLLKEVVNGRFREDLYYRLNVVAIRIPPLRERVDAIPALAIHFLGKLCKKYDIRKGLSPGVMEYLVRHNWPGNVRQLENAIEHSLVVSSGPLIGVSDLPEVIRCYQIESEDKTTSLPGPRPAQLIQDARESLEREMLTHALEEGGSTRAAARILGVSQSTVVRRMKKYNIETS
jgi:PAS domain S-box-containing protein